MVKEAKKVYAMVRYFTGDVVRDVDMPSIMDLHRASLVIVRQGSGLVCWKDKFEDHGHELTVEKAEARIAFHLREEV